MRRSFRDYLFTLALSVVIFAVAAFFLIRAAEGLMGDVVTKIGSQEEMVTEEETESAETVEAVTNEAVQPEQKDETLSFLFMGLDQEEKEAKAIFLVCMNVTKQKATVALIPTNTVVPEGTSKYKLGELYSSRSITFYKDFVAQETGLMPDYYMVMNTSGISNLIDFFGGITYNVPVNMSSFDEENQFRISLQSGKQELTGDQVLQLLLFEGYEGGLSAQEDTYLSFARTFASTFLTANTLSRAKEVMYNVSYHVKTDFEEADMNLWGEKLFNFSTYSQDYTHVPGAATGESFYAISTSRAESMFEVYQ